MVVHILTKFTRLLFENSCLICNAASQNLSVCNLCNQSLNQNSKTYIRNLPNISVHSWGFYDGPLRASILSFKNGNKDLSLYFANILTQHWQILKDQPNYKDTIVVPVPSHPKRIKERGYCHATLLASRFSKNLSMQFSNKFISKIRHTKHMNELDSASERLQNIKDAFYLENTPPNNARLLIIDDILTSGATLQEVAKTLSAKHSSLKIEGLTIACGDKYTEAY